MATKIITQDERLARCLEQVWSELNVTLNQIKACSASIEALLPACPMAHPALRLSDSADFHSQEEKLKLRDGVIAVRDLATLIAQVADWTQNDCESEISEALAAAGIKRERANG